MAFSAGGPHWFLLNASPDLRAQIESFPALHALPGPRNSPIGGVLLTTAEIDASLGLLLLREFQPLNVYAGETVRQTLVEGNRMFGALQRVPDQARWYEARVGEKFAPRLAGGEPAGFECELLPGAAWRIESAEGRALLFFPGGTLEDPSTIRRMEDCEVLLFDGTFWDDEELIRAGVVGRTARSMGHSPVSGPGGTLERLSHLKRPRKIFIHINNTNPMLDEGSAEHRKVLEAGWEVAYDGMEMAV